MVLVPPPPTPPPAATSWPVEPPVLLRAFDPPEAPFGAGHRGIDLAAGPGVSVRALQPGRVAFAGEVAGTPVVTIDHGGWRSTYQPVTGLVEVGRDVRAGEVIGHTAAAGGHCAGRCVHIGVIVAEAYRDPLLLLEGPAVLKPVLTPRRAVPRAGAPG